LRGRLSLGGQKIWEESYHWWSSKFERTPIGRGSQNSTTLVSLKAHKIWRPTKFEKKLITRYQMSS
jgi:hypothetical protein